MADAGSAIKKAMFHAWIAQQWSPSFFRITESAKRWNFHTQASILYQFRACRGLPCDDLDYAVKACMKRDTYNLRVGRYGGIFVEPGELHAANDFSIQDSVHKRWDDFEFLRGVKKPEERV